MYYLLLSKQVFDQADAGATGTAQRTVSLKVLRNLSVPDLEQTQQSKIIEKMDRIDHEARQITDNYRTKLADLDDLRQSLLQRAFAGELT